jgi:hypothetical protein
VVPPARHTHLLEGQRSGDGMKGDTRNYLYVQYARYLEKYQPKMFVFEKRIRAEICWCRHLPEEYGKPF